MILPNMSLANQRTSGYIELTLAFHTDTRSLDDLGIASSTTDEMAPHIDILRFHAPVGRSFKVDPPKISHSTRDYKNGLKFLWLVYDYEPIVVIRPSDCESLLSYEG
jgi:hypothetical protein